MACRYALDAHISDALDPRDAAPSTPTVSVGHSKEYARTLVSKDEHIAELFAADWVCSLDPEALKHSNGSLKRQISLQAKGANAAKRQDARRDDALEDQPLCALTTRRCLCSPHSCPRATAEEQRRPQSG